MYLNWIEQVKAIMKPTLKPAHEFKAGGNCYTSVKHFESYVRVAYQDTGGVWTAGYGETLNVGPNTVMEYDEALAALYRRMERDFAEAVRKLVEVDLTQNMFDALCSFVYNIGEDQFSSSTLLRVLNEGNYEEASEQFLRWKYDNGVELAGLLRRRKCERALFRGEDWEQFLEV